MTRIGLHFWSSVVTHGSVCVLLLSVVGVCWIALYCLTVPVVSMPLDMFDLGGVRLIGESNFGGRVVPWRGLVGLQIRGSQRVRKILGGRVLRSGGSSIGCSFHSLMSGIPSGTI